MTFRYRLSAKRLLTTFPISSIIAGTQSGLVSITRLDRKVDPNRTRINTETTAEHGFLGMDLG